MGQILPALREGKIAKIKGLDEIRALKGVVAYRYGTSFITVGSYGNYWLSSLYESNPSEACCLSFYSGVVGWSYIYRYFGRTVRAVFSENDTPSTFVTLSFDANGGEGTMPAQTFEAGVSQAITANTFTRSGYYFVGWNTSPDGSGTSYTDKQFHPVRHPPRTGRRMIT